jgi:hypothetical protein
LTEQNCVVSLVDLVRAYNQIPVHPSNIQKIAITTPSCLSEFSFMSFGLRNTGQSWSLNRKYIPGQDAVFYVLVKSDEVLAG